MSTTTFLTNESLWQAMDARVRAAKQVNAAIAYFGQGGAKLLPLRKGDRIVVDMSLSTVRAGGTDPSEVEKLIKRGIQVFTRQHLHAKVIVADQWMIAGSANVSRRSQQILDEAAIITNDQGAVRRAREFIDRLCTEPVRPNYLEECKSQYRPPRVPGQREIGARGQKRAMHAKLWIVNLHDSSGLPEAETERCEQGEAIAEQRIQNKHRSKLDYFHWPFEPQIAKELECGDWVIQVIQHKDKSIVVQPPGQFLYLDQYDRKPGKKRWVFHLEVSERGESMTWATFRHAANSVFESNDLKTPRTKAIRDVLTADGLLALWTPGGRISRR